MDNDSLFGAAPGRFRKVVFPFPSVSIRVHPWFILHGSGLNHRETQTIILLGSLRGRLLFEARQSRNSFARAFHPERMLEWSLAQRSLSFLQFLPHIFQPIGNWPCIKRVAGEISRFKGRRRQLLQFHKRAPQANIHQAQYCHGSKISGPHKPRLSMTPNFRLLQGLI